MDRTREFQSLLGPKANSIGAANGVPVAIQYVNAESSRSSFNNEAARIGHEIHVSQLKVDELGKRTYIR